MNASEWLIVDSLEPETQKRARRFIRWADMVLEGTEYRLSIESYSVPWKSGRRTPEQQRELFDDGLSRADGYNKRSAHQDGRAIHFGLRKGEGRFIRHCGPYESPEAHELWKFLCERAERLGFVAGIRWRRPFDPHHFELPENLANKEAPDEQADA